MVAKSEKASLCTYFSNKSRKKEAQKKNRKHKIQIRMLGYRVQIHRQAANKQHVAQIHTDICTYQQTTHSNV